MIVLFFYFWLYEVKVILMQEKYVQRAVQLNGQGYNCAQSVACAFSDILDLDENTIFRLSEGFGGGMGGYDGTCGAISGAVLVISLVNSAGNATQPSKEKTYTLVKELFDRFVEETGSSVCKELKGMDTGLPLYPCLDCIKEAVRFTYASLKTSR